MLQQLPSDAAIESVSMEQLSSAAKLACNGLPITRQSLALTQLRETLAKRGPGAVYARQLTRDRAPLAAAMATRIAPDAAMLLGIGWTPQRPDTWAVDAVVETLLAALHTALADDGVPFIQAACEPGQTPAFLTMGGYEPIAELAYMSRIVTDEDGALGPAGEVCQLTAIDPRDPAALQRFIQVLQRTFEATLDCPALNRFRSAAQIARAYLDSPAFDPRGWFVGTSDGQEVACLVLTPYPRSEAVELTYMGVVPDARGRGIGRELVQHAMQQTLAFGGRDLILAVDQKNAPARACYRKLDFVDIAEEAVWGRATESSSRAVIQELRPATAPAVPPPEPAPALLQIANVTIRRGTTTILDDLSLELPAGRHTALLGPNGSGKTSLLKLLIRQFYPSVTEDTPGTVRILGRDDWHIDDLRRHLGIVSSELDHAFAGGRTGRMTALQAVLSGFTGVQLVRFLGTPTESQIASAREALKQLGASHLEDRTLETMSTGERRRTLIARALVHQPRILVLDEPTTGLDLAAQTRLLKQLRALARSTPGLTLLLVTHHLEEILPEIEHVVLLREGRVWKEGSTAETLTSEILSRLFGLGVLVDQTSEGPRWKPAPCES